MDCNDQGDNPEAENVTLVVIWRRLLGPLLCEVSLTWKLLWSSDPADAPHQASCHIHRTIAFMVRALPATPYTS
ncbi:hypothetical protein T01_2380 [Trichinella spiralis]|uniref:Uncharacterized protein n=1 Tax=Trichinella spiralis TaxID=6334 RepID=A0A0V1BSC2_TRISP|nr:hypothetical protein T01_2380 [Trichinella spiralis]